MRPGGGEESVLFDSTQRQNRMKNIMKPKKIIAFNIVLNTSHGDENSTYTSLTPH